MTDAQNCGACGFTCLDEACVDGACEASLEFSALGGVVNRLIVEGDTVYVSQIATSPAGTLRTVPVDFGSTTVPGLDHPIVNHVGSFATGTVGEKRVYFAGQVWPGQEASRFLYACDTSSCATVDLSASISTQVNGMATAEGDLYFIAAGSDNRLLRLAIDPVTGVPGGPLTTLAGAYANGLVGTVGVHEVRHEGGRIHWNTWDTDGAEGCIFAYDVDELPLAGPASCDTPLFDSTGFVVAPGGTIFAQNAGGVVSKIVDGTLTTFATGVTWPRAVDDEDFYAGDDQTGATIRVFDQRSGRERPSAIGAPAPFQFIDASHPRYLFAAAGSKLYRFRKPGR